MASHTSLSFSLVRYVQATVACIVAASFALLSPVALADEPPKQQPPEVEKPNGDEAKPAPTAQEILERVTAAYRAAKSYRDTGKMIFVVSDAGGEHREEFPLCVEFKRPNLLRLEFTPVRPRLFDDSPSARVLLVADGKHIFARPEGYDGQVLRLDAPETLAALELYDNPALVRVLPDGLPDAFPLGMFAASAPLALLASEGALDELPAEEGQVLQPQAIGDRMCDRVELTDGDNGALVFWVDQKTSVLRRIEFPLKTLLVEVEPRGVTGLSLTAEFDGAELDPKIDKKRFAWQKTPKDRVLANLIHPPNADEAMSNLLGKQVPDFTFRKGEEKEQPSKTLAGKVTVLEIWAFACDTCPDDMPRFDAVRKEFADNDKVQFLALNLDGEDTPTEDLDALLADFQVETPWARVTSKIKTFRDTFKVREVPMIILLDKEGRVQSIESGADPALGENLPPKIKDLLAGEDFGAKQQGQWKARRQQYEQELKDAQQLDGEDAVGK